MARGLGGLLAGQAVVLAAVVAYAIASPLHPDRGLQQIDLLSLREPVAGIAATGRARLVVAVGDQSVPACRAQVARALARRGGPGGVAARDDLVLLAPGAEAPPPLVADPGGRLARALALPEAADGCHPGYAVVDPRGQVRYRTYDGGWAEHSSESDVLLAAVR